jgi:RNA polymerase sigma factor (sigma-70 family)
VDTDLLALVEQALQEEDAGSAEKKIEHEYRAVCLNECIDGLPERSRRLLLLRYHEGWDTARIAAEVKATVESVHMAFSRLRAALHLCVSKKLATFLS